MVYLSIYLSIYKTHTYKVVAHGVHIILQMAFSIIWSNNATQLSISSKMESSIRGEHKEASNIPPADHVLKNNQNTTDRTQL